MTLNEFGRFMQTKSVGRVNAPINEQLTERVFTAMKKIARDTVPLLWQVSDPAGHRILRKIDDETWIRLPKKPILDSGDELDVEDILLDAMALYVMAGLEIQRAKVNMAMYWEEIDSYNGKLIETHLEVATNDSPKFHVFP